MLHEDRGGSALPKLRTLVFICLSPRLSLSLFRSHRKSIFITNPTFCLPRMKSTAILTLSFLWSAVAIGQPLETSTSGNTLVPIEQSAGKREIPVEGNRFQNRSGGTIRLPGGGSAGHSRSRHLETHLPHIHRAWKQRKGRSTEDDHRRGWTCHSGLLIRRRRNAGLG